MKFFLILLSMTTTVPYANARCKVSTMLSTPQGKQSVQNAISAVTHEVKKTLAKLEAQYKDENFSLALTGRASFFTNYQQYVSGGVILDDETELKFDGVVDHYAEEVEIYDKLGNYKSNACIFTTFTLVDLVNKKSKKRIASERSKSEITISL